MNLAIATVEKRPWVVREIARALPLEESKKVFEAVNRLEGAVEAREERAVYDALMSIQRYSMVVEVKPEWSGEQQRGFLEGLALLEAEIDARMGVCRGSLGLDKEDA